MSASASRANVDPEAPRYCITGTEPNANTCLMKHQEQESARR
jgi:hypothetical protein